MTIEEWRKNTNRTYEGLARELGVTIMTARRICAENTCVRLAVAQILVKLSNGELSFEEMSPKK